MKEVTPYFQKAILLADFGWDPPATPYLNQSAATWLSAAATTPVGATGTPNSEMKWTSLTLACLTRDTTTSGDPSSVTLEISSPSKKSSIVVRASHATADRWISALSSAIDASMAEGAAAASALLPFRVRKMGWAVSQEGGSKAKKALFLNGHFYGSLVGYMSQKQKQVLIDIDISNQF